MQKAPYYVGLDIGTSAIRCVVGMFEHHETENTLSVIGVGIKENNGMRKGSVVHAEDVATAISEAISEAERNRARSDQHALTRHTFSFIAYAVR